MRGTISPAPPDCREDPETFLGQPNAIPGDFLPEGSTAISRTLEGGRRNKGLLLDDKPRRRPLFFESTLAIRGLPPFSRLRSPHPTV